MRMRAGRHRGPRPSGGQRVAIGALACVQLTLLALALRDIRRRPADQIRGPKVAWVLASFVNLIGPIMYFAFGRRRESVQPLP